MDSNARRSSTAAGESRRGFLKAASAGAGMIFAPKVVRAKSLAALSGPSMSITNINPTTGGPGTLVTVDGSGFGTDPEQLCAVVRSGNRYIPFQVTQANNTQATLLALSQPNSPMSGPIQMARGTGIRAPYTPITSNVTSLEDAWGWRFDPPFDCAESTQLFAAQGAAGGHHSGGPDANGKLTVTLPSDEWGDPVLGDAAFVSISARLWVGATNNGGDIHLPCLKFEFFELTSECAAAICAEIVKKFAEDPPAKQVNCTHEENDDMTVTITLELANGVATTGGLDIDVS